MEDIDECDVNNGMGPCDATSTVDCMNLPGSYECTCADGYSYLNRDQCQGAIHVHNVCVASIPLITKPILKYAGYTCVC